MGTQELLAKESIGKLLLKYSVPAIIGMIVNALYNVVDRIFIGNIPGVGSLAITGVGVTMPITTIILGFAMLVGVGATTTISIKLGQGRKEEAAKVIGNAISLAVILSLILTIVGLVFGDVILTKFGASDETLYYAKAYIYIILLGTVFNMVAFALNNTIRGDGNPKLAATIMVIGCVTNIILDAVFIFIFNMGIQGAAIATVISQLVTAVIGLEYYISGKSNLKFDKSSLKLDKQITLKILSIGAAPFAMQIAASLVQVIANNVLKEYGTDLAIGAMATISSVSLMCLMPIFGINQGAQPIIGFNYGAKQEERAQKAFKLSAIVATIILVIAFIAVQVFPEAIIGVFNKDPQFMNISVKGMRIYLLMLPIVGISITGSNYIQSIGEAKTAMFLSLLRQVILLVPFIIILPRTFGLGLDGVWIAQPVSDVLTTAVTIFILVKSMKVKEKVEVEEELLKEAN
ncbi:MATE family efflux transporter [Clostridium tertium]|uniref:MATE family efflux transporter n=1 Tax=Clostridium TaxID=1485 RepID=UPI001157A557|nr:MULTISPECIES: MATE family efflux transporter [Clostridium]MBS5307286.1 MATE family efflux transporter [Clostridium sp.]MDB1921549.1 MATE family efflux transporter [Clostridium tertium]MDB1924793.1 MATE family efflux transporter [Clostridium tertium]MDB1928321.1 MATE family efflux transporter [Clostridium tertium]MDB1946131.1 MATE family efflux transporter [Clostridium tertium]